MSDYDFIQSLNRHQNIIQSFKLKYSVIYINNFSTIIYILFPYSEFLGLSSNIDMIETQLESAILSNLQKFLMELGKGYAFVAHQQHIHTKKQDYYIYLVFYNYILKCFVLIDLKAGKYF